MNTSPAVAMLVGTLVLGAMGGRTQSSTSAAAAPAVAALANQATGADTSELAGTVTYFIEQLRPMVKEATADFVRSLREEAGGKPVERRVPITATQRKEAAALLGPRPVSQHVHLKRPPPAPPMTEAELAEVMTQRAMYERIKAMHEAEDLAAAQ